MFICYTMFSLLTLFSTLLVYRELSFKDDEDYVEDNLLIKGNLTDLEKTHADDDDVRDRIANNCIKEAQSLTSINDKDGFKRAFFKIIFRSDIIFLLASTAISGMFLAPMLTFHYLFLKDLNASAIMYSLITATGSIGGCLGFRFSNKLIKLMTPFRSLIICYVSLAFVQLCFSVAETTRFIKTTFWNFHNFVCIVGYDLFKR